MALQSHKKNCKAQNGITGSRLSWLLPIAFCLCLTFSVSASSEDEAWGFVGGVDKSAGMDSGFFMKNTTAIAPSDVSRIADAAIYEVQVGDTLSEIAKGYGITKETIKNVNGLRNDSVQVGQKLTIIPVDGVLHVAGTHETADSIANKYKVAVEDILRQNKLEMGQSVMGRTLIIPGGKPILPSRISTPVARYNVTDIYQDSSPVAGLLLRPTAGVYTQYFTWSHKGIDIADPTGPTVYAASSGTVVEAYDSGWNGGYGKTVVIDHGGGLQTRYAHMRKVYVSEGDQVISGHAIGMMGSTGRSTGTHLHFETVQDGNRKNPIAYF